MPIWRRNRSSHGRDTLQPWLALTAPIIKLALQIAYSRQDVISP
jgi:hypothetical protein